MMTATMFDRSRNPAADQAGRAAWNELFQARRRALMTFALVAPLTGVVGPLLVVPSMGSPGWLLVGAGLLTCVALLFHLARIDADMSDYQLQPVAAEHAYSLRQARHASRPPHLVQSLSGARARRAAAQLQLQPVFHGARRRPYRLAH